MKIFNPIISIFFLLAFTGCEKKQQLSDEVLFANSLSQEVYSMLWPCPTDDSLKHSDKSIKDFVTLFDDEKLNKAVYWHMCDTKLHELKGLHLYGDCITDEGVKILSNAIKTGKLYCLKDVRLSSKNIGDAGAVAFAEAAESGNLKNLVYLDLSNTNITDKGALAIARVIKNGKLPKLHTLDLLDTNVGDEGIKALTIQDGKTLRPVCLLNKNIGDNWAIALAKAIKKGGLKDEHEIYLVKTKIGRKGVIALADVLKSNKLPNLKSFILDSREIGDEEASVIEKALENKKLPKLGCFELSRVSESDRYSGGVDTGTIKIKINGKSLGTKMLKNMTKCLKSGKFLGLSE